MTLFYEDLYMSYKLLIKRKLWSKLDQIDKAFIIACLKFSKIKKKLNNHIQSVINRIINKAKSFIKEKIEIGKKVAINSMNGNVAKSIDKLRNWFNDINYLFWLGLALSK